MHWTVKYLLYRWRRNKVVGLKHTGTSTVCCFVNICFYTEHFTAPDRSWHPVWCVCVRVCAPQQLDQVVQKSKIVILKGARQLLRLHMWRLVMSLDSLTHHTYRDCSDKHPTIFFQHEHTTPSCHLLLPKFSGHWFPVLSDKPKGLSIKGQPCAGALMDSRANVNMC